MCTRYCTQDPKIKRGYKPPTLQLQRYHSKNSSSDLPFSVPFIVESDCMILIILVSYTPEYEYDVSYRIHMYVFQMFLTTDTKYRYLELESYLHHVTCRVWGCRVMAFWFLFHVMQKMEEARQTLDFLARVRCCSPNAVFARCSCLQCRCSIDGLKERLKVQCE